MHLAVVTLFPNLIQAFSETGLVARAIQEDRLHILPVDLRDFTHDRHRTVDDYPYGGGPGMVLRPEPFFEAVEALRKSPPFDIAPVLLMTPRGAPFNQAIASRLVRYPGLIILAPRYEGVDERVAEVLADEQLCVGDCVTMGGDVPAMVVMEAIVRLLPGCLGNPQSSLCESFSSGLLEYPQYTRPPQYRGYRVPDILLSGDHQKIRRWRLKMALATTLTRRPDLLNRPLSIEEKELLSEIKEEQDHEPPS
ncbi:MAG: tRNA (guanosine(37)-N1)-methyltransferase TrmD [bacterium JZ-2024 1]